MQRISKMLLFNKVGTTTKLKNHLSNRLCVSSKKSEKAFFGAWEPVDLAPNKAAKGALAKRIAPCPAFSRPLRALYEDEHRWHLRPVRDWRANSFKIVER